MKVYFLFDEFSSFVLKFRKNLVLFTQFSAILYNLLNNHAVNSVVLQKKISKILLLFHYISFISAYLLMNFEYKYCLTKNKNAKFNNFLLTFYLTLPYQSKYIRCIRLWAEIVSSILNFCDILRPIHFLVLFFAF